MLLPVQLKRSRPNRSCSWRDRRRTELRLSSPERRIRTHAGAAGAAAAGELGGAAAVAQRTHVLKDNGCPRVRDALHAGAGAEPRQEFAAYSRSPERKLKPRRGVEIRNFLIRREETEWVPNGPSEQPRRKPGVREGFRASGASPRCTAVREKRPNSWAFQGRSADGETVRIGRVGGGRGARPETFSTFEHTRVGDVARVEI